MTTTAACIAAALLYIEDGSGALQSGSLSATNSIPYKLRTVQCTSLLQPWAGVLSAVQKALELQVATCSDKLVLRAPVACQRAGGILEGALCLPNGQGPADARWIGTHQSEADVHNKDWTVRTAPPNEPIESLFIPYVHYSKHFIGLYFLHACPSNMHEQLSVRKVGRRRERSGGFVCVFKRRW